jgi:hypothetical protein
MNNSAAVSAGQIGPSPTLPVGATLGFYDPVGFDQFLVRCRIENSASPNLQALALGNLKVMLTNVPPAPAIYGSDFSVDPVTLVPSLAVSDTIPGCHHRLVYTESLLAPTWYPVATPPLDGWKTGGGMLTFNDPNVAGKAHRYYRVQVR